MKCFKCNTTVKTNVNFCPKCGTKLHAEELGYTYIEIESSEQGIPIFINGTLTKYKTPAKIKTLKEGRYSFCVEDERYYSDEYILNLKKNNPEKIEVKLYTYVELQILNRHKLFKLYIDNQEINSSSIKIKHGTHIIKSSPPSFYLNKIEVPSDSNVFLLDINTGLGYNKLIFENFNEIIKLEVRNVDVAITSSYTIDPLNVNIKEENYFDQANSGEHLKGSYIWLLSGNYFIKWKTKSKKATLKIFKDTKNTIVDLNKIKRKKRKVFNLIIQLIVAAFVFTLFIIFAPGIYEEQFWNKTKKTNTINDFMKYIDKFGYYGKYKDQALYIITESIWEKCCLTNTLKSYGSYLDSLNNNSDYVEGTYESEALSRIENIVRSNSSFIDYRDNQVYKYKIFGQQTWMITNLNYERGIVYGYEYCKNPWGKEYNWKSARNSCPAGWHLPSDKEWQELESFLGITESELEILGWREPNSNRTIRKELDIKIIPHIHKTYIWTSSNYGRYTSSNLAWGRMFSDTTNMVNRNHLYKNKSFCVRCIKDN